MPVYSAWYNVKTWTLGYNYLKDPMMKYVSLTQIFRNSVHSGHLPLGVPQQTVRKVPRFPVTEHNDHRAPMQNVYTRNRALFTKAQWNLPSASSKQLCSAAVHLYVIAKWHGVKHWFTTDQHKLKGGSQNQWESVSSETLFHMQNKIACSKNQLSGEPVFALPSMTLQVRYQRNGEPLLQKKAERIVIVQPEEKVLVWPYCSLPEPKGGLQETWRRSFYKNINW